MDTRTKVKPVKWTLDTLTSVKPLTNKALLELERGRQVNIYSKAGESIGASSIGPDGVNITFNNFPMIGNSGIIKDLEIVEGRTSFFCTNLHGEHKVFTPESSDIVFIIEKDDFVKERLNPEYVWKPN